LFMAFLQKVICQEANRLASQWFRPTREFRWLAWYGSTADRAKELIRDLAASEDWIAASVRLIRHRHRHRQLWQL